MANVTIDYLSFSVDLVNVVNEPMEGIRLINNACIEMFGRKFYDDVFVRDSGWKPASGRRPYRYGHENKEIGLYVHFGGQSNALIQFSGNGCKFLESSDLMMTVLVGARDRMTRLDIATDIETSVRPEEVVKAGYNARIKTQSITKSPSGETAYVGSRTSAKFCRVYRYEEPHPRAKMLRIEYETKKVQARITAECILANGLEHTADMLSKYYEWSHEVIPEPQDYTTAIPSEVSQRSESKTLHWLLKQCAPAFKKLVVSGAISDPHEFFEKHFMPPAIQENMFNE